MGRNAQPIEIIQAKGKSHHLTKAEIAARKEAEIKLGAADLSKIKLPTFIENDVIAFKRWKECVKDYKEAAKNGFEVLTTSDVGTLAMYCKAWSEHEMLLNLHRDNYTLDEALKLQTAINKKRDLIIKMEDRLFLNPLAKVRNVPKREKKKADNPMENDFGV